jgi:hypothetical protein
MAGFEGVPEGIKQVLLATQEIKRLSENVRAPGGAEVRDIDRRVARLEGMIVGQTQAAAERRRRITRKDG